MRIIRRGTGSVRLDGCVAPRSLPTPLKGGEGDAPALPRGCPGIRLRRPQRESSMRITARLQPMAPLVLVALAMLLSSAACTAGPAPQGASAAPANTEP